MCRALAGLAGDRQAAIGRLQPLRKRCLSEGSMADYFFPALRRAGLTQLHDAWFEDTWGLYGAVLRRFPKSHNTLNTAAWTAARAMRRLDEAGDLIDRALQIAPNEAAYLDTRAEVWFGLRDRPQALRWSDRALHREPTEQGLLRQHERFAEGAFPTQ
jgi:tetratricopeptide (TPR) repeat protein